MMIDNPLTAAIFGIFGLLLGSFLNVVIYRLPVILKKNWRRDCVAYLREQGMDLAEEPEAPSFNLLTPRSRCRQCGHAISALENIPVLSYLVLGGKCRSCRTPIGIRYPMVEIATAVACALCGYHWGWSWAGLLWAGFCTAIITLVMIDWDTMLLPDDIVLPLLWAGLLASWGQWIATPLSASVLGAAVGYLSLWSVGALFKLLFKKEGMGHGDYKLLAAMGAWLGVGAIVPIVLFSSLVGACVGIALRLNSRLGQGQPMPYGPFLGGAGLIVLALSPATINQWIDRLILGG